MSKDHVGGEDEDENIDVNDAGKELLYPSYCNCSDDATNFLVSSIPCRPSLDSESNIQEYYFPVEDMLRQLLPH